MERLAAEELSDRLAGEWEALAEGTGAAPFLRPGWFIAWSAAFARGRVEFLVLRRGGALCAVLPTVVRGPVRTAMANWHTPELAIIADSAESAQAMADALLQRNRGMLDLLLLDPDGAAAPALRAAARARGQRTLARVVERSPYVDTTGSPDEWRAGVDHHLVTELRRRRRRLEERGVVSLAVERGDRDLDGLLAEGLAIEAAGWKGTRGTAIRARADTLRFYTDVARWAAARGWLRLAFLRVDGVGVAFDLALEQGGRHWLLKTGYDPAWRTHSPGKLLRQEMIGAAFAGGLRSYEFLGDDEAWKLEWNVRLRERLRLQVFGRTPAGHTLWWAYTRGRPLLHRARRLGAPAAPRAA